MAHSEILPQNHTTYNFHIYNNTASMSSLHLLCGWPALLAPSSGTHSNISVDIPTIPHIQKLFEQYVCMFTSFHSCFVFSFKRYGNGQGASATHKVFLKTTCSLFQEALTTAPTASTTPSPFLCLQGGDARKFLSEELQKTMWAWRCSTSEEL